MLPSWFNPVFVSDVFTVIIFVLPILIGNTSPMFFGGGVPMDLRRNWFDGKRILGNNKTIRGFIVGLIGGFLMGLFTKWWFFHILGLEIPYTVGFFQGLGAVTGDAVGSFIKRRLNIPSGGSLIVMDQLGFMVFGLGFARIVYAFPWYFWAITLPLTFTVHFASNVVGYTIGWKDVWW
ncbi:MAG: CDP-2,3-bis-(O-geranylgeranyl)-sn-glycerol synthase [Asgard group archaeon]|nr:CDP-2,3-bis-(O-geranylgeranyl)-sn-glycerol synthase [Asgard group archaeon]